MLDAISKYFTTLYIENLVKNRSCIVSLLWKEKHYFVVLLDQQQDTRCYSPFQISQAGFVASLIKNKFIIIDVVVWLAPTGKIGWKCWLLACLPCSFFTSFFMGVTSRRWYFSLPVWVLRLIADSFPHLYGCYVSYLIVFLIIELGLDCVWF